MAKRDCNHFAAARIDGVCLTCEREEQGTTGGPLVTFVGGKDNWNNGPTIAETMRENVPHWKESGIDAVPVDRNRWV